MITPASLLMLSSVAMDSAHVSATASASALIVEPNSVGQAQLSTTITASPNALTSVNGRYYILGPPGTVFSTDQSLRFVNTAIDGSGPSAGRTITGLQTIPAGGLTTLDIGVSVKAPAGFPPGAYDGTLAVVVNFD